MKAGVVSTIVISHPCLHIAHTLTFIATLKFESRAFTPPIYRPTDSNLDLKFTELNPNEKYFSIVARSEDRKYEQQQQHVVGKVHSSMLAHTNIYLWHNALLNRMKEKETGDGRWNAFLIGTIRL